MFPNLLGRKAYFKMSNADMARIIGTSRKTYENKVKTGRFTANECKRLVEYFNEPFDFLFATLDEERKEDQQ